MRTFRSVHRHLAFVAVALLLATGPSPGKDCPEARARDCNRNGNPDDFDLDPTFGFETTVVIDTGASVRAVAVADLDGDGRPDIAAAGGAVRTYRNLGVGLFQPSGTIGLADAFLVAAGDLDGDGDADLAVGDGDHSMSDIVPLLNDGSGAFAAGPRIPLADTLESLVIADFDLDLLPDIAAILADGTILLFPNLGGAIFDPPRVLNASQMAWGVTAADLDGDGFVDLAALKSSATAVIVFFGQGGGNFDAVLFPVEKVPLALAVADVDSDGLADLAVAFADGVVRVLQNSGGRAFSPAGSISLGDAPESIVPLDVDGDGLVDLLAVFEDPPGISDGRISEVLLNERGAFLPIGAASIPAGSSPVPADLDADGRPDLVLAMVPLEICLNVPVPSRDCNGDCIPDECGRDCNRNGILDSCEIASGSTADCEGNGIPDECEFLDCNGNGTRDFCEIASGTSADCDGNGVPDSCDIAGDGDCDGDGRVDACEIAAGLDPDCDGNGVPDSCDVAGGGDCDGDGRVDACEVAAGDETDCDGNGVPDVCERGSVLSLDAPPAYFVDMQASSSIAVDLDGDGDLDLAAAPAPRGERGLSLLLNDGSGRFALRRVMAEVFAREIASGDFDGDGLADLAVAGPQPSRIRSDLVILANRGGLFTPSATMSLIGIRPLSLESADLDLDGNPDLCAATGGVKGDGLLSVFLGGGKGDFVAGGQVILPRARSFRIADLDGDGDPDLAIGHADSRTDTYFVGLIRNDGNAAFEPAPDPDSPAWYGSDIRLEAGDIDGDGRLDLAGAALDSGRSRPHVFFNQGGGSFDHRLVLDSPVYAMAMADLDGDANSDIAFGNSTVVHIFFKRMDAFGLTWDLREEGGFTSWVQRFQPGDFDGDGRVDLALFLMNARLVTLARNRGGGSFSLSEEVLPGDERFDGIAEVTDMDGDGRADIIAVEPPELGMRSVVSWNEGGGAFGEEMEVPASGWGRLVSGDFDGNGLLDLVAVDGASDSIVTIVQPEARVFRAKTSLQPALLEGMLAADLDRDGDLDLALQRGGSLSLLRNDGTGAFAINDLGQVDVPGKPWSLAAGDMDGDGAVDLVTGEDGRVSIRSGSSGFAEKKEFPIGGGISCMALVDIGGDGDLDLAAGMGDSKLRFLENAEGSLSEIRAIRVMPFGLLLARDMDGDGDGDLILGGWQAAHAVGMLLNDGQGGFRAQYYATGGLNSRVDAGDLDGDGDRDVVTLASWWPSRIAILRSAPWTADADRDGVPDVCSGGAIFLRGDAAGGGALDLTDAIVVLEALFLGGPPVGCDDAADSNDDGRVDLSDPVTLLGSLFLGAGALPPPSAGCGLDPTPDGLGCGQGC
jgi:hypothetical protein